MIVLNAGKYVQIVKKNSDCCKGCNKVYEDCKCCLEYVKLRALYL